MTTPTHCGHPESGFVTSGEGTSYCPACADEYETRLTPGFDAGIEVGGTTHRKPDLTPERIAELSMCMDAAPDRAFWHEYHDLAFALLAERERQGETFKRQLRLGTEDVRRERDALRAENERLLAALAGAYRESDQAGRAAIGRLCDVHIDRSGALLGQVRALAEGDTDA